MHRTQTELMLIGPESNFSATLICNITHTCKLHFTCSVKISLLCILHKQYTG